MRGWASSFRDAIVFRGRRSISNVSEGLVTVMFRLRRAGRLDPAPASLEWLLELEDRTEVRPVYAAEAREDRQRLVVSDVAARAIDDPARWLLDI